MSDALKIIRRSPLGCAVSTLVSIALVAATACAFVAAVFAIYSPGAIRNKFEEKTGFFFNSDKIFVNIARGTVSIRNMDITNPKAYPENGFLKIKRAVLKIDPLEMLRLNVVIRGMDLEIDSLQCYRISATRYNVREFLENFSGAASLAAPEDFSGMRISINSAEYMDLSEKTLKLSWKSNGKTVIETGGASSPEGILKAARSALEKSDSGFVLQGVKFE